MAPTTRLWMSCWFLVSTLVVFWDAGYCLLRPRSMEGGDLNWIWTPYNLYAKVDYIYGVPAFENNEGFTSAQALLNLVENFINLTYLYSAHIAKSPVAPVIGFTGVVMTFSKTVLYWAQEYYCGYCKIGHNTISDITTLWVIPNGIWLLVPGIIICVLGNDIATSLRTQKTIEDVRKID
ncbi:hypothetical protein DACRYDRAFT_93032 [Dacryopinax primogenitus]|uniref:EXPERA domain-containing protein n=1 Tax=Dacryopinax primogenitus (strain DJM 731) TaxID=1858805 RepID=M5GF04_DACPD|nr:uncharacterized protein DACRYDRAFT_93032 [Dacryopinax primogenitus]EJU05867.1 hypothetical protein DACRYDRAFT_93032 [Dacryopinax primogenitus]